MEFEKFVLGCIDDFFNLEHQADMLRQFTVIKDLVLFIVISQLDPQVVHEPGQVLTFGLERLVLLQLFEAFEHLFWKTV